MEAVKFKGHNLVLAEDQPQYKPLPVCWQGGAQTPMTSCYKLSWKERLRLLFKGRLFVTQLTFGQPLQPQSITTEWEEPKCVNCGYGMGQHKKPSFFCPPKMN